MIYKTVLKAYYFGNRRAIKTSNNIFLKVYRKIFDFLFGLFYGGYLSLDAKIGNNVKFVHQFYGVFISSYATIGDNCIIYHHVTLGRNIDKRDGKKYGPIIGNNVFIGANVNIIGKTTIGDNCVIGAGTTISNATIPPNTLVVSQKYREIPLK